MSASLFSPDQSPTPRKRQLLQWGLAWLDALAILAWGTLLLKYWLTRKLHILIHPDYNWLAILGGIGLLIVGSWRGLQLLKQGRAQTIARTAATNHIRLLPIGWCSLLLLITAIAGLSTTPRVFKSQAAFQRGVADAVALTRTHPQAFRSSTKPEDRSLIDWIRTLNVYPEPDSYAGQNVNVEGFVIHPPDLPGQYLLISRFVLTCCAADAYPVSLPVKIRGDRSTYPPDTWLRVEGKMMTENLEGKRQLTIAAQKLTRIPEPQNPYEY